MKALYSVPNLLHVGIGSVRECRSVNSREDQTDNSENNTPGHVLDEPFKDVSHRWINVAVIRIDLVGCWSGISLAERRQEPLNSGTVFAAYVRGERCKADNLIDVCIRAFDNATFGTTPASGGVAFADNEVVYRSAPAHQVSDFKYMTLWAARIWSRHRGEPIVVQAS